MEEKVKQSSAIKNNKKEENEEKKQLGLDLSELKALFQLLKECNIDEFELKKPGLKIRVKQESIIKDTNKNISINTQPEIQPIIPILNQSSIENVKPLGPIEQIQEKVENLHYIISPMVGTFYRAPNPGADPYIDVNQEVKKGQVVCIIEAMKIMNEIESDVDGEVVAVYVGNGEPVEFGQKLIAVRIKS